MGLEALYLLIPASIVLALAALALFLWAIRAGQFDDLETPAIRMLFDDAPPQQDGSPMTAAREAEAAAPPGPGEPGGT